MSDALTMLGRTLLHSRRNSGAVVVTIGLPVLLLLLFVGVFGGELDTAFAGGHYIDYLVPGILLMTVGYGSTTTALAVNRDVTTGIVSRFRTMPISRASVLTGHAAGSALRTLASSLLVVAVALALGFRPPVRPLAWLAAFGLLALVTLAMTWLGVAVGLAAPTAEAVSPFTLIVQILPFLSSAFVPPSSMSPVVRWLAAHEPFTPIIDTLRSLLLGTPTSYWQSAVVWGVVLTLIGYLWSRALFRRDPAR